MRLNDQRMYERMLASDATFNGRFITGVLTTGIYCLPGCKARKPKPENVRFFPTCEAARAAGLRACRKCHPDDFARGADPVLEDIETLAAEVRAQPAAFADTRALVRRSGFGTTRLFELVRQHYHVSPADLLLRARLEHARRALLAGDAGLLEVASAAGFESLSVFHDHFRRAHGMTPAAYRALKRSRSFEIALPEQYPLAYLKRGLGRDPHSVTERLVGDDFELALRLDGVPTRLSVHLGEPSVTVSVQGGSAVDAHRVVTGLLGLDQDAPGFVRLAGRLGLGRLVRGREELRISQTPSAYDGLLWAIIGQQINLPFAFQLRRRLYEMAGEPVGHGLIAPPTPAAVAALDESALTPHQYSARKAEYVVQTSRLIASGALDLEALRFASATRAERTLLGVRGLGPWSVNYLLMRSLGFMDCVPVGDTGVTSALQALFKLEDRPGVDATLRLTQPFSPYRSLATYHLWQFGRPLP